MTRNQRMLVLLATLAGLGGPAWAQTAFTYQGQIRDNGVAVTGQIDVQYRVYNAAVGGTQVSGVQQVTNLSVTDGLFATDVDFGADLFDGSDLWLQVSVRNPAGVGGYVALTPRQKITAAPYANTTRGLTVNSADDVDLVGRFFVDGGTDFVGVGRSSRVSSAEAFGVQSSATSGYGGMYLRTDGASGWPFYGYAADTNLMWTYFDGTNDKWHVNNGGNRLTVRGDTGAVGIGEESPLYRLHVESSQQRTIYGMTTFNGGSALYGEADGTGSYGVRGDADGTDGVGVRGTALNGTGVVGTHEGSQAYPGVYGESNSSAFGANAILGELHAANAGQTSAAVKGVNEATDNDGAGVRGQHLGGGNGVEGTSLIGTGVYGYSVTGTGVRATSVSGDIMQGHNSGGMVFQVLNDGTTVVPVLQITGGSDLCEKFDVSGSDVRAGLVVSIDPASPGDLRVSSERYDRTVAGIISGANGINPGMLMGQDGSIATGRHPVALTGRVWTWCDADSGAITPGDLLTTSATPGHAMRVGDHAAAQGAVIGKAMTSLADGERGLVLVLVNLQ